MINFRGIFKKDSLVSNSVGVLEDRFFMVYVILECLWVPIQAFVSFVNGLHTTALVFIGILIMNLLLALYETVFKRFDIPKAIYLTAMLIKVPVLWYFVGGNSSAAGSLFILEVIFFCMVCKGKIQPLFILCVLASSGAISSLSGRMPERFGALEMSPMQHGVMSSAIGSSVTIYVVFLIFYQKKEFNNENRTVKEYDEQLKKSNQMQKNFLANMSHEIRSPLGIVLGFNDLIKETEDVNKIKEYSDNISHAGKTLQTVINDILDYSKIEAGKLDIIENDYSLGTMLSELEHDIKLRCGEKGLTFTIDKKDDVPDILFGDVIRVKQCVFNILTNAVKYTKTGYVKFTIASEGKDENGDNKLAFSIEDSGRGISEELIPKLFSSFQRLDEGQDRGIEGTGLGLTITKSLVDQMKGTIDVKSKVGEGTTFTIHIVQKDGNPSIGVSKDEVIDITVLSGKNVLVVDDVDMNLIIIETILTSEGLNVTTVLSGKEAVQICKEREFDVILLDHMMPEMDGIETYKHITEEGLNTTTSVIMLTANAMTGAREEYLSYGIKGYVSKPIDTNALNKELVTVIGS